MSDANLFWTLCALIAVNSVIVILAYVSVHWETKRSNTDEP